MLYMALYTARTMASTRTQIYLTAEQRTRLDDLGKREQKSMAELIRTAIDRFLDEEAPDPDEALRQAFGAAPDIEVPPRSEWDRNVWGDD